MTCMMLPSGGVGDGGVAETVLEAFGPRRLMFGSDWPVLLVAASYQKWVTTVAGAIAKLTADEQARIWGGTAVEAYGL